MIITINLNPALDKTVEIPNFEAGTVNRVLSLRLDAGGKGINVSKVILSLGGKSRAVGILGGVAGSFIVDYLDRIGIENSFYFIRGETRTNLKIIDYNRKTNTDINEPGPPLTSEDIEILKQMVFSNLEANTVVVFSGSIPMNVDKKIYGEWISAAKKVGVKTVLDADGELLKYGIEAGPFIVKPNIYELERVLGKKFRDIREVERFARSLLEKYGIELIAVSLGEKGAVFVNKERSVLVDGIKVDVKSTVGAGDAMVAALAYSSDRGYSFEKTVKLAVASGTANVMTSGSQAAHYETIVALEKRVTLEDLKC
jgi:1-phosphofructokinase